MRRKSAISISNSRWLAYAAASAASGLIAAPCAECAIHYSGKIKQRFDGGFGEAFPLAAGASLEFGHSPHFTFTEGSTSIFFAGSAQVFVKGGSVAGYTKACISIGFGATASNLASGASIAARPFTAKNGILCHLSQSNGCSSFRGKFIQNPSGYVGFRFNVGNGLQYGWARVRVKAPFTANYVLIDYAYADPGETILAGQKSEDNAGKVEDESLGALAFGAAGLMAWRKRKSVRKLEW